MLSMIILRRGGVGQAGEREDAADGGGGERADVCLATQEEPGLPSREVLTALRL